MYDKEHIGYDPIYDFMEGWVAYAKHTDTYTLRRKITAKFEQKFFSEISTTEVNRRVGKKKRQNQHKS